MFLVVKRLAREVHGNKGKAPEREASQGADAAEVCGCDCGWPLHEMDAFHLMKPAESQMRRCDFQQKEDHLEWFSFAACPDP
jgi:hypothetical protein